MVKRAADGAPDGAGGYPDGARATPVPDLFFSRDLPALDDPVAIKVMLHVLWRIQRRPRGEPPALRAEDLAADPTLRRGVAALGIAEEAIGVAIDQAIACLASRKLLLALRVAGADAPERWLLVNGREGRAVRDRLAAGERLLPDLAPAARESATTAAAPPTIFAVYEQNIGLVTPRLAEELREAEADYPRGWIEEAIDLAVANNARKWSYVRAILERWAREGRGPGRHDDEGYDHADSRRRDQTHPRRDSEGPYAAFIRH